MARKINTPIKPVAAAAGSSNDKVREQLRSQHTAFTDAEDLYSKCSARRKIVAWVLGITASIGTSYVLGAAVEALTSLAMLYTGSAFLAMMVYIVGLVLTVYAGFNAFASTFGYIVSDDCVRHIDMAQRKVNGAVASISSLFGSKRVAAEV